MTRDTIKGMIYRLAVRRGLFVPFGPPDLATVPRDPVPFVGDLPTNWGSDRRHWTSDFVLPRSPTVIEDLTYTPSGMAWVGGRLIERYSLRQPTARDLLRAPPRPSAELAAAVLVQAQTPYTYGDWVGQHLVTLTPRLPLPDPLLLPANLYDRTYVRRDLQLLNVTAARADRSVLVRHATVLPQERPNHSFTAKDVLAYRRAFGVTPQVPRRASVLYLSRQDEVGAASRRTYPSRAVADLVRELGGRVVLASRTTLAEYRALAGEAETVVADHGSALCNLLFWNTRTVIELFTDEWWNTYFLFLAHAAGVGNYRLVNVTRYTCDGLVRDTLRASIRQAAL